jgi:hypothetical protein
LFHSFFLFLRGASFFGFFFVSFFPVVIGVLHIAFVCSLFWIRFLLSLFFGNIKVCLISLDDLQ